MSIISEHLNRLSQASPTATYLGWKKEEGLELNGFRQRL
ncbi:hypothetical protein Thiowin_00301 [Thiorhodovibrio winogradskyi]|uniref:Uncharacterized protein n=1 Tax=Thiorhodovibrio winogradskyi TaxID=77007 RepID=A0ABZ0S4B1_9GAMM